VHVATAPFADRFVQAQSLHFPSSYQFFLLVWLFGTPLILILFLRFPLFLPFCPSSLLFILTPAPPLRLLAACQPLSLLAFVRRTGPFSLSFSLSNYCFCFLLFPLQS